MEETRECRRRPGENNSLLQRTAPSANIEEWLTGLDRIATTINRSGATAPLLEETLPALIELLGVDAGQILLLPDVGQDSHLASFGLEGTFLRRLEAEVELAKAPLVAHTMRSDGPFDPGGNGACPWCRLARAAGYRTLIAVPLSSQAGALGICVFYQRRTRSFTAQERHLLRIACGQLATAVERGRLLAAERTQRQHIEAVRRAGAAVNRSLELAEVLDSILTELGQVVAYDSAAVILQDEDGYLIAAARGLPAFAGAQRIGNRNELSEMIARTRQPLILEDAQKDSRFSCWLDTGHVRGWMGVPLLARGRYLGHLTADSRQRGAYSEAEANRALSFAQQAAVAVVNARLHQDLQAQLATVKETQARLLQSEKLAAIGQLVSGVAHELNNPLGAIHLYAELMLQRLGNIPPAAQGDLKQILTQVGRASSIVDALLDFARQRPPERRAVVVNEVIGSTVELMSYELRTHNVSLELDLAPGLPPILADPQQLQQVLVNLMNNAYQAMSRAQGGGRLRLATRLDGESLPDARAVTITVVDNGPGIAATELGHVFEPFYTTREGEGTGLGLAVCHGIVNEHEGRIWCDSVPGIGTTFSVALPVPHEVEMQPAPGAPETGLPEVAETARILIVDDEEGLRLALKDILTMVGYEVNVVGNGEAALEAVATAEDGRYERRYDLILCDIRMPGLAGPDFYRQLLTGSPEPDRYRRRVLFITGDRLNPCTREFLEEEQLPWLAKPFDMDRLVGRVREMLAPL